MVDWLVSGAIILGVTLLFLIISACIVGVWVLLINKREEHLEKVKEFTSSISSEVSHIVSRDILHFICNLNTHCSTNSTKKRSEKL